MREFCWSYFFVHVFFSLSRFLIRSELFFPLGIICFHDKYSPTFLFYLVVINKRQSWRERKRKKSETKHQKYRKIIRENKTVEKAFWANKLPNQMDRFRHKFIYYTVVRPLCTMHELCVPTVYVCSFNGLCKWIDWGEKFLL